MNERSFLQGFSTGIEVWLGLTAVLWICLLLCLGNAHYWQGCKREVIVFVICGTVLAVITY